MSYLLFVNFTPAICPNGVKDPHSTEVVAVSALYMRAGPWLDCHLIQQMDMSPKSYGIPTANGYYEYIV